MLYVVASQGVLGLATRNTLDLRYIHCMFEIRRNTIISYTHKCANIRYALCRRPKGLAYA